MTAISSNAPLTKQETKRFWRAIDNLLSGNQVLKVPGVIGIWEFGFIGTNSECLYLRRGGLLLDILHRNKLYLKVINPPAAQVYASNFDACGKAVCKDGELIGVTGIPGVWYHRLRSEIDLMEVEGGENLRRHAVRRAGLDREAKLARQQSIDRATAAVLHG